MAGISLAVAQAQLDQWIEAQATVSPTRSTTVGDTVVTFHDLDQITRQIDYWNRMVMRLSRGSGIAAQRVVIHD